MMGTADFVSAEQARDSRKADIRSDLYSLGCTFYFLLTGQPPFPGGSLVEKVFKHANTKPTAVMVFRPEVPPAVDAVLAKMLAKKPEDRYQTPAEVAAALAPVVKA